MNYGHQTSVSFYDTTQIENDLTYLQRIGITRLRIVFPEFDSSSTTISHCQDMVTRALTHGFYVVWGVTAGFGSSTLTATRWASAKTYITNTLAPWAQSNGLSELCLTNESELAVDGTTLTAATVRSDIRSLASTVKTNGYTGKASYSTSISSTYLNPWISEGIGSLDFIAWNSYDTFSNFNNRNSTIVSAFGNQTYISEFGSITHGQSDYASEQAYYNDVLNRVSSMRNANVPSAYFFCFRDGSFGVPTNSFGLVQTTNTANWAHYALRAVSGTKLYALRVINRPVSFGIGITTPTPDQVSLSDIVFSQGVLHLPADTVALAETSVLTGKPVLFESIQLSESIGTAANTSYTADVVQLLETTVLVNATLFAPDIASLLEMPGPLVQILAVLESVRLSDSFGGPPTVSKYALRVFGSPVHFGPSSIVIPAESVTLTEQITLIGTSTYTQTDETISISDDLVSVGQPQIAAEQVQLSEDTIIFSNVVGTTNTVQLVETIALSCTAQLDPDVASLLEVSNPTGQIQSAAESVQLSDSATIPPTINRYALRAFGSPVVHGSSSIVIPAESVTLIEQVALTTIAHFLDAASIAVLEILVSAGQTQIEADQVRLSEALIPSIRYGLRVFGAPVRYASAGSTKTLQIIDVLSVSLSESSLISSQTTIIDTVSLDETSVFAEDMTLTEAVGASEVTAEVGTLSFAESAQLDEMLQLVNAPSLSESVQALELLSSIAGTTQFVEQTQLDESLAIVNATSFTENLALTDQATFSNTVSSTESVTLQETSTFVGTIPFTDSAQITETLANVSLISFTENVALADQAASFAGATSFSEVVSLDEANTLVGVTSIASEAVQLSEVFTPALLLQITESVALSETSTYAGQPQIVESVQSSETLALSNTSQISAETTQLSDTFTLTGQPSFVESVSATDLSFVALSATISFIDTLQILETPLLLGTSTLASENVSVSDTQSFLSTLALLEAAQLLEAVALSGIASSPSEAVSLTDASSFQSALQALTENILLADSTSFAETLGITESVQVSDSQPQFAGVVTSLESAQISETIQQTGTTAFIVATVLDDQTSLAGAILQIEALLLSDTFTSQTFVRLQVPADSVALSEIFALLPPINMTFYVRKGNITLYVRKGNATFYARKGNATFYERE